MKIIFCTSISVLLIFALVLGCKKSDNTSKVDSDGLTQDIRNLVPDSILNTMKQLGMPIYGGANPPLLAHSKSLSATYLITPFVLVNSNRPGDNPGAIFNDFQITFSAQDNDNLKVKVDYVNGAETGKGIGSFIVGDDCNFSVFVQIDVTTNGYPAKSVEVISGTLMPNGIQDIRTANFMIDDFGDPQNIYIEKGQGRVFKDKDEFADLIGTTNQWYEALPACPCTWDDVLQLSDTKCPEGKWETTKGDYLNDYHLGATYEARWTPSSSSSNQHGQQCTYSADRKLITAGLAAASPDFSAPGLATVYSCDHYRNDILPWGDNKHNLANVCTNGTSQIVPCWQYMQNWPANNGLGCPKNEITPIGHMSMMTIKMSCFEVTNLIKAINNSAFKAPDVLKDFINGKLNYTPVNLKSMLQTTVQNIKCSDFEDECSAINKAIAEL